MTIQSCPVSLPSHSQPKTSYQHESQYGLGVSLEMNDMAGNNRAPASVNKIQTVKPESTEQTNALSTNREVEQMETIWEPYKNRYRVLAACLTTLGNGMNDAANGALIQSLEKYSTATCVSLRISLTARRHYHISYGIVSIIFLCNALGFLTAAFFVSSLSKSLWRAKTRRSILQEENFLIRVDSWIETWFHEEI